VLLKKEEVELFPEMAPAIFGFEGVDDSFLDDFVEDDDDDVEEDGDFFFIFTGARNIRPQIAEATLERKSRNSYNHNAKKNRKY
tara:strand:- start:59 stop:310 length:252 start_codon:yes stop_codon:yes gene_type:complete